MGWCLADPDEPEERREFVGNITDLDGARSYSAARPKSLGKGLYHRIGSSGTRGGRWSKPCFGGVNWAEEPPISPKRNNAMVIGGPSPRHGSHIVCKFPYENRWVLRKRRFSFTLSPPPPSAILTKTFFWKNSVNRIPEPCLERPRAVNRTT